MNDLKNKSVVLAYSGGLDTTYCALFLSRQMEMKVHCLMIDTGGFSEEDVQIAEKRANLSGATSFKCIDLKKDMYEKVIRYLIYGNVLKNNTYPLSVSAERISQAMSVASYANLINADAVAHGSTGAGNDQVRFDMIFGILIPEKRILTPVRDQKLSREEEISFVRSHGIEMNFEKAVYSINTGLWGTSVGGKETLGSGAPLPEEAWPVQVTKTEEEKLELEFKSGELVKINNNYFDHPADAIMYLEKIAAPFGIGRDIHTGDTIIGIKGRVGFQASAAMLVIKSHHALEKHILTKWQLYWKDQLSAWYGNWMHEGHFLDPVMRNIESFLVDSQRNITGRVFLSLYPKRFTIDGIDSPFDLMNNDAGTYGEINNNWTADDVKGFTKIFGNQVSIWQKVNGEYMINNKYQE